jgi:hypothetical protein
VLAKKIDFKRKDGKEAVHIALDIFDAIFLPGPYFGGDIIINRYLRMLFYIFGNLQIEARIVYQNQHIRFPVYNIHLTHVHVPENGTQMQQHRNKAHVSQIPVMFYQSPSHLLHQISAKEAELSLRVLLFQSCHQIGGMQIARSLTGNQIVFHNFKSQFFISANNA